MSLFSDVVDTVFPGIGTGLSSFAGAIFPKIPELPTIPTPPTMPTPNDEVVRRFRRRKLAQIQARSGRASTILGGGDASEHLGS